VEGWTLEIRGYLVYWIIKPRTVRRTVWRTVWQTHDHHCHLQSNALHKLSCTWVTTPANTTMEGLDKRQIDVQGAEKIGIRGCTLHGYILDVIDGLLSPNSLCYSQQPTGHITTKRWQYLNRWWQRVRDALCHCRPSIL
jgi:hypothetical protein